MNNMSHKDFLNSIRADDEAVQRLMERRDWYIDAACRGTGTAEATRVSGTASHSRVEDFVCRMIDYEAERGYDARIDALADKRLQAEHVIARIRQPRFRQVLTLRYLQPCSWLWTWDRIAEEMGDSLRAVLYLHGWALKAYEDAMGSGVQKENSQDVVFGA